MNRMHPRRLEQLFLQLYGPHDNKWSLGIRLHIRAMRSCVNIWRENPLYIMTFTSSLAAANNSSILFIDFSISTPFSVAILEELRNLAPIYDVLVCD